MTNNERKNLEKRLDEIETKLWYIEMAERLTPHERREKEELEREKRIIEMQLKEKSYVFDLRDAELTEEEYNAEAKMLKKMLS